MITPALRRIFPEPCAIAVRETSGPAAEPAPTGIASVDRSVPVRRREFTAGRAAAHEALRLLGFINPAVGMGDDRAPRWPAGAIGSIAHAHEQAIAVAARTSEIMAVGVDLERTAAVNEELWPQVLTPAERRWLERLAPPERARWATVFFCAKEAFYKFQYPLTHAWVDFDAVEVAATEAGTFSVQCRQPLMVDSTPTYNFEGRFVVGASFTLAGLYLPALVGRKSGDKPGKGLG